MPEMIANMSDDALKARIINRIRQLEGRHRIDVTKYRPRRSDRQNRYYWPCIVKPFGDALREAGNDYTNHQAHEILKHKFLRRENINMATGEVLAFTESTANLDTSEFNEYLDRCAAWLAGLGIEVPDPRG